MLMHPCSDTGRLQSEIRDVERKVKQCTQSHEVHQMQRDVYNLEHTLRELGSVVDGLRSELQTLQEENDTLKRTLEENGMYL